MPDPGTQPAGANAGPSSPPGENARAVSEGLRDEATQERQSRQATTAPCGLLQDAPAPNLERFDTACSGTSAPKPNRWCSGTFTPRARTSTGLTEDAEACLAASLGDGHQPDSGGNAESRRAWWQNASTWSKSFQKSLADVFLPDNRRDDHTYGTLEVQDIGRWVIFHHDKTLIQEIRKPKLFSKRIYRVSFVEMQRMHLRKLQIKLVKHAVDMHVTGNETGTWEADLAAYIQAMKDYGYIVQSSKQPPDYFLVTGERDVDRFITDSVIRQTVGDPENLNLTIDEKQPFIASSQPWDDEGRPIGDTRDNTPFYELLERSFMGAVGAGLLLGPMWIMVLVRERYASLITTTVCVAAFGLVAVFWLEKPMDVLSVTAAYAAVLVVFVGLNT